MANVPYIDVAGMRKVVHFAKRLHPGRALVLREMQPHQREAFKLLDWNSAPGLHLDDVNAP